MAPCRVLRASLTFRNPSQLLWVSLSPHAIRAILSSRYGSPPLPSAHRANARAPSPPFPRPPSEQPGEGGGHAAGRRLSDPEPVPASLARGQTGPAHSPRAAGHAQPVDIPQAEPHSGAGLRDRSGGREQSPGARRTADPEGPGETASSLGVHATHGHQVEAALAQQLRDPVGRQESYAGTHWTELSARLGVAERLALTWARVALGGRELPAGSPILLLALPLAFAFFALRHLAEDERSTRTRLGDGAARQVWSKGLLKSLSPERRGSERAALGRPLSLAGSFVDSITWSVRYVLGCLGATLGSRGPGAAGSGVASLRWPDSLPYSPKRERCSQSAQCSHLPAAAAAPLRCAALLLPARSGVPTSFGEVLAGSFSIARRLDAGASFAPSPRLAPSLFPTTPPPRGADTPPGGA